MKTQITAEQFKATMNKPVVITPFKPYVSKQEPARKLPADKVDAFMASLERGKKSC